MINKSVHYYGWHRINEAINNLNIDNITIIDYVDTYFLQNNIEIINSPWLGIIHHTVSEFSNNNINNLFNNNIFINSLNNCKAFIVLSHYNKDNLEKELLKHNFNIDIYVLKHPIPPTFNTIFNIKLFENTLNIYNIGGWLRNPYTIYHSNIYYNNNILNKYKLKGNNMEQYFPSSDIDYHEISNKYKNNSLNEIKINKNNNKKLSYSQPNNYVNYFFNYMINYIKNIFKDDHKKLLLHLINNHNSVKITEYLDNENYLNLLKSNIVFCDYIDCSASNTIVECIATGTPIILNYHPAIEEYLGSDYPLYFNKIYNIKTNTYNINTDNILNAHYYLLNIKNNSQIELSDFLNQLKLIIDEVLNKKYIKPKNNINNNIHNNKYINKIYKRK